MLAVGLMSGTSLDGIDVALCEINGSSFDTTIQLLAFETVPFKKKMKEKIKKACFKETSSVDTICSLNFELGKVFSDAIKTMLSHTQYQSSDLDFIASHGQTIYHQPFDDQTHVASTLQIGEAAIMAYEHKCPVISNFRVMDMAAGGQGAPLVPYTEYILYSEKNKSRVLLNLGGIGNVTWLDGSMDESHVIAFDTGPANMMINAAMKKLYHKEYDHDGEIASQGELISPLLDELICDPYFDMDIPKSTGRELFGEDRTLQLIEKYQNAHACDIVYTFTYFTVWCVVYHLKKYIGKVDELIVGGGGAHNKEIMRLLKSELPRVSVMSADEFGINADAKEAMAFVVLGNETMHQKTSNMPSATGAKSHVILGNMTYGGK